MTDVKKLIDALAPLARLEIPTKQKGNAGFYSIRHSDILAARAALEALSRAGEQEPVAVKVKRRNPELRPRHPHPGEPQ